MSAKALAAQQGTTSSRLIAEGLRLRMHAKSAAAAPRAEALPVFEGRGRLASGVEPRSNKALLDALGDDA